MKLALPLLLSLATADLMPAPSSRGTASPGNPAGCPKITCVMFCTDGLQKDDTGCDKCSCVRGGAGKLATGTTSCTRDAHGCCADLGVAWCADQNICVSTQNAVVPCKSWGNNPPVTSAPKPAAPQPSSNFGTAPTFPSNTGFQQAPTQTTGFSSQSSFQSSSTSNFPSSSQFSTNFQSSTNFPPAQPKGLQTSFPPASAQSSSLAASAKPSTFPPAQSSTFPPAGFPPAQALTSFPPFQSNFNFQSSPFPASSTFPPASSFSTFFPSQPTFPPAQSFNFPPIQGSFLPAGSSFGLQTATTVAGSTPSRLPAASSSTASSRLPAGSSAPASSSCSEVMCTMYCANGFQKDARGCDMCACAGSSADACPSVDCGSRTCDGGFSKDTKGCPTCICLSGSLAAPLQTPATGLDTGMQVDALVAVDRPTISLNPCLPAPGPCKASQKCIPSPKQCIQAPCPQYACVAAGKGKNGKNGKHLS